MKIPVIWRLSKVIVRRNAAMMMKRILLVRKATILDDLPNDGTILKPNQTCIKSTNLPLHEKSIYTIISSTIFPRKEKKEMEQLNTVERERP